MNITPELPEGSALSALGAGVFASLLYLRKFLSRQGVDIKKDGAEYHLIETLQAERDKAMAAAERAWSVRAEDAKLIGELTSEVKASREIINELRSQLGKMSEELHRVSLDLKQMRDTYHDQSPRT